MALRPRLAALAILATASIGALVAGVWWLHSETLVVRYPADGEEVGLEGVEVLVAFAPGRSEAATFRALLNGADVTHHFEVAGNGAHGRLYALLPGSNQLRFEIFARLPGDLPLLVERRDVRVVQFRPPVGIDRG